MKALLLACLLLLPLTASAQVPVDVVAGVVLTGEFDHDGANTTGYRLFVDNNKSGADLPMTARNAAGVVTFTVPALTRGAHTIALSAFNQDAESARAAVSVQAKLPTPGTPKGLRIVLKVTTSASGEVTAAVESVQVE